MLNGPGAAMESQPRIPSSKSLMMTMNQFVQAVEEMDRTIMIPSKLQDIDFPGVQLYDQSTHISSRTGTNNNNNADLVPLSPALAAKTDLFTCYKMLNAVRSELSSTHPAAVGGSLTFPEEEPEERTDTDEQSQQVAAAFRHHLQGLFGVLHQMTSVAETVTTRYQEELGEIPTSLSLDSH